MTLPLPVAQRQPHQKQPNVRLSCTYQGYQGVLEADIRGCKFNHDLIKADFPWESVKSIRIMTKHVKDVPTSVLVIKTARQKQFSSMFLSNTKHYFYGFDDIVEAVRELMELKNNMEEPGTALPTDPSSLKANKQTVPLAGENSNSVYSRLNQSPNANAYNSRVVESVTAVSKSRGANVGGGSFVASPLDDDDLSSASAPQLRNTGGGRDYVDEENDGRGGGRVNMPLIINRQKHADPKENTSLLSQPQRCASSSAGQQKRRRPRNDISNDYRYVRWEHNISVALSYYPRGLAGILLGLFIIVVLLILYLFLMPYFLSIGSKLGLREISPQEKINRVVQGLDEFYQWQRKHQSELIEGNSRQRKNHQTTQMIEPTLIPPVGVKLNDMIAAVKELLGRYINLQREMGAVRLRRVRRELSGTDTSFDLRHRTLQGIVITGSADDSNDDGHNAHEFNTDWLNEMEEQPRPRRLSLESVSADIRRWRRFFHTAVATAKWILWGKGSSHSRSNQPLTQTNCKNSFWCNNEGMNEKQPLIRYSEVLYDGQTVVEDVIPEDAEERRKCLHLSRELVRLAELLEEMLLEYQEVVMAPRYEAFLRQVPLTPYTTRSSTTGQDGISGSMFLGVGGEDDGMLTGQSSYLLRTILLRRQTLALLQLEPLGQWDGLQYENVFEKESIRSTVSRKSFPNNNSRNKNKNSERIKEKPTREEVEAILRDFVESSRHRNIGDSWMILRNILEEVRYWHNHEKDWQTFVLWRLNAFKENNATVKESNTSKNSYDDFDSVIAKIPVFRGLWCFLDEPVQPQDVDKKEQDKEENIVSASLSNDNIISLNTKSKGKISKSSNEKDIIKRQKFVVNNCSVSEGMIMSSDIYDIFQKGFEVCPLTKEKDPNMDDFSIDDNVEEEEEGEEEELEENGDSFESGYDGVNRHLRQFELMTLDVQLRWVNAFELFLLSLENGRSVWNCNGRHSKRLDLGDLFGDSDDESADMKEMAQIRRRILSVLWRAETHYGRHLRSSSTITSWSSGALIDFVRESANSWKSSWWRFIPVPSWLVTDGDSQPLQCLLWRMQPTDPTVRRLYRDVLRVPLGEAEDIPWMLLHLLSIPPDLLRVHHNTEAIFKFSLWFLVLFLLVTVAAFIFL
ncbi:hypothetical protein LSM04_004775 [Trypanosoma melophagium]|uniref:uncharacterized protein n=1 Tax=Trypanosoma melophagium TaxID=715481 RepID=UPI00351A668A|nr:hypothetical protein LSM04_004775 [Trypanosoma melophagium]